VNVSGVENSDSISLLFVPKSCNNGSEVSNPDLIDYQLKLGLIIGGAIVGAVIVFLLIALLVPSIRKVIFPFARLNRKPSRANQK